MSDDDKVMKQALKAIREMTGSKYGKHTRRGPQRDKYGDPVMWKCTQRPPWTKRQENRAANRRARQARKVNR